MDAPGLPDQRHRHLWRAGITAVFAVAMAAGTGCCLPALAAVTSSPPLASAPGGAAKGAR